MSKSKIICFALICFSSLCFASCKKDDDYRDYRRPCEMTDIYYSIKCSNDASMAEKHGWYNLKRVKLTGHDITCFDERSIIASSIFKGLDSLRYTRIEKINFHESDRCLSIDFPSYFGVFDLTEKMEIYDNGYIYCSDSYYGEAYFKAFNLDCISNIFDTAEKEFTSIENKEFDLYKIRQENITIEKWLDSLQKYIYNDEGKATKGIDIDLELPYSDNDTYSYGVSSSFLTDDADYVFKTIKSMGLTFTGFETFDYDADYDSILTISTGLDDRDYGYSFIMYGGTNFTKIGIKTNYGDYSTGDVKCLVATYNVSNSEGEKFFNDLRVKYFKISRCV